MGKQQFEATEGLLNDVMKKQSGSIEKAILEGVMKDERLVGERYCRECYEEMNNNE